MRAPRDSNPQPSDWESELPLSADLFDCEALDVAYQALCVVEAVAL